MEQTLVVPRITRIDSALISMQSLSGIWASDLIHKINEFGYLPRDYFRNVTHHTRATTDLWVMPIMYVAIRNQSGKYLAYQRKSKDPNLQGKISIGFGGHADLNDYVPANFVATLLNSAIRELDEEVLAFGYGDKEKNTLTPLQYIILNDENETNRQHIGFPAIYQLDSAFTLDAKSLINDSEEVSDAMWLTKDEIIEQISSGVNYEPWSAMMVRYL